MCTALSIQTKNKEVFLGRTLDFSFELDPSIYVTPRDYKWLNKINNEEIINKYKFIAIGEETPKIIFTDGVNESGLGVAALYFQGEAHYQKEPSGNKVPVGSIDFIAYLLGNYSSTSDVLLNINKLEIIGIEDEVTNTIAPLHWFVVDKTGTGVVIEPTKKGLEVTYNPINVLANAPDFKWHLTNLRNYLNLSPKQKSEAIWEGVMLKPFGQGSGTYSLPGDYTSPSRFVRAAYLKSFTQLEDESIVNTCFNILKSVSIPKGVVITDRNTSDYTQYTAFINLNEATYYFNTYNNGDIIKASINDADSLEIKSLGKLKQKPNFPLLKNYK